MGKRLYAVLACGALGACTSGAVTVPSDAIFYEVPRATQPVTAPPVLPQASGRDDFTGRIERVLAETGPAQAPAPAPADGWVQAPVATDPAPAEPFAIAPADVLSARPAQVPQGAEATPLDDDLLNLNLYTLEQQRIDAAIAERELEEARRQLVVVQPGASVPQTTAGVNIALYAKQTSHAVGERRYSRPLTARATAGGNCRRFSSPDQAQRMFLASGGPERDPYNLDPDGDGFACDWNPEPFRRLRM